jgi:hypothetical protein
MMTSFAATRARMSASASSGVGDHARRERRGVELMLGVQDQRRMHGAHPVGRGCRAVQQMQEMRADRIVVGAHLDAPSAVREMMPVAQHRAETREQLIGDVARTLDGMGIGLGDDAAQRRHAGPQHVHGMTVGGKLLEHGAHRRRKPAQRMQFGFVGPQLGRRRQPLVNQQMRDFLELAARRHIENVVAAVMQIVAGLAHGAQRRVACRDARQRDRFLRLESPHARGRLRHGLVSSWCPGGRRLQGSTVFTIEASKAS